MTSEITFEGFPKIPRLSRECVITEKLDGTNAQVIITEYGDIGAASRSRLLTPNDDNYGFARWVDGNKEDLLKLGPGRHFGEWWGLGIQRGYDLTEKRFSLFNVHRWGDPEERPECCDVVPLLAIETFSDTAIQHSLRLLSAYGSVASPGYMRPEGIVIYHTQSKQLYKKLIEKDELPKGIQ